MALTDVQDILTDANFQNLTDEEKIKVLSREDPDFNGLPEPEKAKVVGGLQGILNQLPTVFTLPGQRAGSLLTGSSRGAGVSDPFSGLPPEEKQRQIELEVFGKQFPKTAITADLGRFILESGGGLLGAIPGAPAGPAGSIATGGLGFAGGKQLADILEMGLETPRGQELSGRSPLKGATELGTDVATGIALEGLIRGASPLVRRGFQGIANAPGRVLRAGTDPQAQIIADQLAAKGVQVTPAMASQAPLMRGTEAALESFPFSGARLAREFEIIERQFAEAQEQGLSRFGPKQGDVAFGEKVKGMLQKGDELSREAVSKAYDAPEALMGDTIKYPAKESSNAARKLLRQEKQQPGRLAEEVGLLKDLSGTEFNSLKLRFDSSKKAVKDKISQVLRKETPEDVLSPEEFKANIIEETVQRNLPRATDAAKDASRRSLSQMTPEQLGYKPKPPSPLYLSDLSSDQFDNLPESTQEEVINLLGPNLASFNWPALVRSRARVNNLIEVARSKGLTEKATVLEGVASGIRKDLKGFAEQVGGDAVKAIETADAAHVAREALFGNPKMMKLLEADPESFKRLIARNESSELVSKLKQVAGPQGFAPIKRAFAEKIFSTQNPLEEFGDDTLKAVFDPTELADLKTFVKQAEFLALRRPDQSIRTTKGDVRRLVNLSPFGLTVLAGFAGGGVPGAIISSTIPPAVVAKLWLSPTGRRYLMEGSKIEADSKAGRAIAGSIRALVAGGSALQSVNEEPSLNDLISNNRERMGP